MRLTSLRHTVVLFTVLAAAAAELALDNYVAKPDPAYGYEVAATHPGRDLTVHVLRMRSQRWLTEREIDRPLWEHWLNVVEPNRISTPVALLFIGGGSNRGGVPQGVDPMFRRIARDTGMVVAESRMVPNQPLVFAGDGRKRSEDELIAYAWGKYLRTADPKWLPRLPMTKAAVRAMDTVIDFCGGKGIEVGRFIVAGGSKRGWTTWTTAAVDPRVTTIAPMVVDILNLEPSMLHHYRAYGFRAPAIEDYVREGVMDWIGTKEFGALLDQVDPYRFRDRFTIPKYLINAAGDQFFLPDSSQFYFDDLPGEKYLRYVPNTDHSLDGSDVIESFVAWIRLIVAGEPRPRFTWEFPADGRIIVRTQDRPDAVKLWSATNPRTRDFRLETIGKAYRATPLKPSPDGVYTADVPTANTRDRQTGASATAQPRSAEPTASTASCQTGWAAYFVEFTYRKGRFPLKFTTPVRVTPETLPHPGPLPKKR